MTQWLGEYRGVVHYEKKPGAVETRYGLITVFP
jgi:hypothetical protein